MKSPHTLKYLLFISCIIFTFRRPKYDLANAEDYQQEWKPFVEQWDDDKLNTATDFSFLIPQKANQKVLAIGTDLVYENGKPAKFFGTSILRTAAFLNKDQAEKTAKRLSKLGCNLVRFHRVDATYPDLKKSGIARESMVYDGSTGSFIDVSRNDTQHLDKEALDRFDYFFYQLKEHGIYIWLDFIDITRNFKKDDNVPLTPNGNAYSDENFARKQTFLWEPKAIELQYKFVGTILEHVNPYTKIALKDDPALAFVCLINEALVQHRRAFLTEETYNELKRLWNQWLNKNHSDFKLRKGETCGKIEIPQDWYKNGNGYTDDERSGLFKQFLNQKKKEYIINYRKFLKKLGYQGQIIGSQTEIVGAEVELEEDDQSLLNELTELSDMVDYHAYINKSVLRRETDFELPEDIPGIKKSEPFTKMDFWNKRYGSMGFFDGSKWNKPYSLSEFAEFYPSPWRSECIPLVSCLCKKNGFDVSIFFAYNSPRWLFESEDFSRALKQPPSGLIFFNDPATMGTFRVGAMIMQKVESSECDWNVEKGFLKVNSSFIQGGTGFFSGEESFENITIKTNGFSSIYIMAIGYDTVADSERLLISAVSQAQNTGFVYSHKEGIIKNGTPPILINPVHAEISFLLNKEYEEISVWALNSYGERGERIDTKTRTQDNKLFYQFAIGQQKTGTVYYEIEKGRNEK